MAKKPNVKFLGIALIVLGVGLAFYGYQMSGSMSSKLSVAITGSDTDRVIAFYAAGAISILAGLFFIRK
ncbi:hypothetical protein SMGD1_2628 [Sulfurimonas gotlandica GD1]|uniref:DUF3185 family protein n=1 Tax=Sulfurimonas gotlandica (strain DSM 19862 / JCM 16533 / GD1) TaxID=929558 RepID=B6BK58_SULGG|nr:DUF3185 family protein [Sulfurimonas gotlandica]EDZ62683.1 conserved hypothetical protein [Sulfurimonas gotlandica GD1]EHP31150.1 hypothetical protein SMGD1_2628 [Sulfurimonas gotlandica GD1]